MFVRGQPLEKNSHILPLPWVPWLAPDKGKRWQKGRGQPDLCSCRLSRAPEPTHGEGRATRERAGIADHREAFNPINCLDSRHTPPRFPRGVVHDAAGESVCSGTQSTPPQERFITPEILVLSADAGVVHRTRVHFVFAATMNP